MSNNELTEATRTMLRDCTLVALGKPTKPGAAPSVRPIAMGEALLKLAGRLALKLYDPAPTTDIDGGGGRGKTKAKTGPNTLGEYFLKDPLDPQLGLQFGVSVDGGVERAVHFIREAMLSEAELVPGDRTIAPICLTIDARNAFNSPSRQSISDALQLDPVFAPLRALFDVEYGAASFLIGPSSRIASQRGVRQGSVLGSAFFCAVMHPMLIACRNKFPDMLVLA